MDKQTVMSIIRLVCMIGAPALAVVGIETDADMLFNVVMLVVAVGVIVWGWWKNAPMTEAAKAAQSYLEAMKLVEKEEKVDEITPDTGAWKDPEPAEDGSDV